MLVTDTVRRDVTPLFLGAEPAGPENSSYRMQDYIQRMLRRLSFVFWFIPRLTRYVLKGSSSSHGGT